MTSIFPDRPDTPEFWKLSEIVLRFDGRIEAAAADEKGLVFLEIVSGYIDIDVLSYMAMQRALRARPSAAMPLDSVMEKLAAIFIDGFIMGCEYERSRPMSYYTTAYAHHPDMGLLRAIQDRELAELEARHIGERQRLAARLEEDGEPR